MKYYSIKLSTIDSIRESLSYDLRKDLHDHIKDDLSSSQIYARQINNIEKNSLDIHFPCDENYATSKFKVYFRKKFIGSDENLSSLVCELEKILTNLKSSHNLSI